MGPCLFHFSTNNQIVSVNSSNYVVFNLWVIDVYCFYYVEMLLLKLVTVGSSSTKVGDQVVEMQLSKLATKQSSLFVLFSD